MPACVRVCVYAKYVGGSEKSRQIISLRCLYWSCWNEETCGQENVALKIRVIMWKNNATVQIQVTCCCFKAMRSGNLLNEPRILATHTAELSTRRSEQTSSVCTVRSFLFVQGDQNGDGVKRILF